MLFRKKIIIPSPPTQADHNLEYINEKSTILAALLQEEVVVEEVDGSTVSNDFRPRRHLQQMFVSAATSYRTMMDDKEFAINVLSSQPNSTGAFLQYFSESLKADREVVTIAIEHSMGYALIFASTALRGDRTMMMRSIEAFPPGENRFWTQSSFDIIPKVSFQHDRDLFLALVSRDGKFLRCASEELRNDKDLVAVAIQNSLGSALAYASPKLKADRSMVMLSIEAFPPGQNRFWTPLSAAIIPNDSFRHDKELFLALLARDGRFLKYAADDLRADRDVAMAAGTWALPYAFDHFQDDEEIVRIGVNSTGIYLKMASMRLRNKRDIVLCAVQNHGRALEYASTELKCDREVVRVAIINDGSALELACNTFRADREMVDLAVKTWPSGLMIASSDLQLDLSVVTSTWSGSIDPMKFLGTFCFRFMNAEETMWRLYQSEIQALDRELQARSSHDPHCRDMDRFHMDDTTLNAKFAVDWSSRLWLMLWLVGQTGASRGLPEHVCRHIVTFTGIDCDIPVANRFFSFGTIMDLFHTGFINNKRKDIWDLFVWHAEDARGR